MAGTTSSCTTLFEAVFCSPRHHVADPLLLNQPIGLSSLGGVFWKISNQSIHPAVSLHEGEAERSQSTRQTSSSHSASHTVMDADCEPHHSSAGHPRSLAPESGGSLPAAVRLSLPAVLAALVDAAAFSAIGVVTPASPSPSPPAPPAPSPAASPAEGGQQHAQRAQPSASSRWCYSR